MPIDASPPERHRTLKLGLFVAWLSLVIFLTWHHAYWRDEIRAFSIALQDDSLAGMLGSLRGEGHPAVWYLLLRLAHGVAASPAVLPVVSIGVASVAVLLLVLRSPFRWWMIALLLLGRWTLFEYSVMARNYGISVLLMFLFAACYPKHRDRGVLLGILVALLANTNVHSVLLAGGVLLFWLIDTLDEHGMRWTPALRTYLLNVAVSAAGLAICAATIYPTYNDAALLDLRERVTPMHLSLAVLSPAMPFSELGPGGQLDALGFGALRDFDYLDISEPLMSLIMFGCLLGLVRSPAAFVAGLAGLIGLSLFFVTFYGGSYRHQALWLAYLVSLYWIVLARGAEPGPHFPRRLGPIARPASAVGFALFVLLLALQIPGGMQAIADAALGRPPLSRSRDFAAFVSTRADLKDAIIIADPDFIVEPLAYYLPNRTYLMREERFGNVVRYTKNARRYLSLEDILATAGKLRAESGQPVLILLAHRLDPSRPGRNIREGYSWNFLVTPELVQRFLASTRLIARFAPAKTDESFDVYLFDAS